MPAKYYHRISIFVSLTLVLVASGCRSCNCKQNCRPVTQCTVPVASENSGVVTASFDSLHESSGFDYPSFFHSETNVGLNQVLKKAACNSKLANLIENERLAVRCESGCIECVDRFLAGQAKQQRLKSAADAAELLIRLAGTQLQTELIAGSQEKTVDLKQTIEIADEEDLATAEPEAELRKQEIELERLQNGLEPGVFELNVKLNLLLGIDSCHPQRLVPNHHFNPQLDEIDVEQQVIKALSSRSELKSLRGFNSCGDSSKCYSVLSNLDPRLGLKLAGQVKRCFLLRRKQQAQEQQEQCCESIRQHQLKELANLQEELVRQEVIAAVTEVQKRFENLQLENRDLNRLVDDAEMIESSAVLDAQESFLNSIANFAEQQQAKARRIEEMVEFEVAKIRLAEATGQLNCRCN